MSMEPIRMLERQEQAQLPQELLMPVVAKLKRSHTAPARYR